VASAPKGLGRVARAAGVREEVVEGVLRALVDEAQAEKLKIREFGVFYVHESPQRTARNPRTHELITVPARRVLKFRASPALNARIEAGGVAGRGKRFVPRASRRRK
jgi:nucleoid DNA-binding protein